MTEKIEHIKLIAAALAAFFMKIFGATSKEIFVLMVLMGVDTVFGWLKAIKNNEWKSRKARLGFIGKIVELVLIACLYALDWLFSIDALKYIGTYYFIICEVCSVIENYAQINGNLPDGLVEILSETKKNLAGKLIKVVKEFINKDSDKK